MEDKLVHPKKAHSRIIARDVGNMTDSIFLQLANVRVPMLVMLFGNFIDAKLMQFSKAHPPSLLTLSGMSIDNSDLQSLKA